jgi:hypothetical protein
LRFVLHNCRLGRIANQGVEPLLVLAIKRLLAVVGGKILRRPLLYGGARFGSVRQDTTLSPRLISRSNHSDKSENDPTKDTGLRSGDGLRIFWHLLCSPLTVRRVGCGVLCVMVGCQ